MNSVSGCLKTSIALLNSVFFSHDIFHKRVLVLSLPISPSPVITHHFVSNTHHLVIVKNNKPFLFSFPTLLKGGVEKGGGGRVFFRPVTLTPSSLMKNLPQPKTLHLAHSCVANSNLWLQTNARIAVYLRQPYSSHLGPRACNVIGRDKGQGWWSFGEMCS